MKKWKITSPTYKEATEAAGTKSTPKKRKKRKVKSKTEGPKKERREVN